MRPNIFSVRPLPASVDAGLLLVRLVVGLAFILIGWGKIQHPTSWMGPDSGFPAFLQVLAAVAEFGGGIALILGLVTRLAAFGLVCTMAVAVWVHAMGMGDPFVNPTGGGSYQLPAVYLVLFILLLLSGPGRYSLDKAFFGTRAEAYPEGRLG